MKQRLFLGFMLLCTGVVGQSIPQTMTPNDLLQIVIQHHPVAMQAGLLTDMADAQVTAARGGFDPYLMTRADQKMYDDKEYFTYLSTSVKANTRLGGLALKAGYDYHSGAFLNPEATLPNDGLIYAGVSLPLIQGLMIDGRRAALQQAKIAQESNEAQRQELLNNLCLEAMDTYWRWFAAYSQVFILDSALELALVRKEAVKQTFTLGDISAIDTVEALTQVQNRAANLNKAIINYVKASAELSNYLWIDGVTPLVITENITPPRFDAEVEPTWEDLNLAQTDSLVMAHPEVRQYQFKVENLEVDRRLKTQKILPQLDVEYNFLRAPVGSEINRGWSFNDYKWGLNFSMPVPMRTGRGETRLAQLKVREAQLGGTQKQTEVRNKISASAQNVLTLRRQVIVMNNAQTAYTMLLNGERISFEAGESSLFLVNAREVGLIDVLMKLVDSKAELGMEMARLRWSAGVLYRTQ
jgi:outer membrane protein TolC